MYDQDFHVVIRGGGGEFFRKMHKEKRGVGKNFVCGDGGGMES